MRPSNEVRADRREGRSELKGFQRLFARAMIFLDAPDHTRVRQVMSAAFRPADLQRLAPRIEQAVARRLAAVDSAVPFDFVSALARPLPAQVIGLLMGLDEAEGDAPADLVAWSDELADFIGAPAPSRAQALSAQTALLAMARHFDLVLARRRAALAGGAEPRDDVIDRLLQAEREGQIRGSAELLAQCVMLLFAGHETTRHLLANGLRTLLLHTDQWHQLQRNRATSTRNNLVAKAPRNRHTHAQLPTQRHALRRASHPFFAYHVDCHFIACRRRVCDLGKNDRRRGGQALHAAQHERHGSQDHQLGRLHCLAESGGQKRPI
jgi:cytochrome P450